MTRPALGQERIPAAVRHILGTDTGVGKTHVTGLLLEISRRRRISALPLKPVHSGWPRGEEWGCDLLELKKFIPSGLRPEALCRYRFEAPISPFSASAMEDRSLDLSELSSFLDNARRHLGVKMLFIEGIGGVCCPLGPAMTYRDFLVRAPAPALLVSRVGLGSLNHAIMSREILEKSGVTVAALVLNEERPYGKKDLAASRARWELEQLLDCPVLGPLRRGEREQNLEALEGLPKSFWDCKE